MNKKSSKYITILAILVAVIAILGIIIFLYSRKYSYKLQEISNEEIEYYKLEQDEKYGVIDKEGNVVIEAKYVSIDIPNPSKAIFIKSEDGKNYTAIDNEGKAIFTDYDNIEAIAINNISSNIPYEKTVLKYKLNGLYGLIDFNGKKITENIYNSITNIDYKEGNLKVEQNGQFGVINIKGTTILKAEYDSIISDGYYDEETKYENAGFVLRVKTDNGYRFGYANRKGKIILETLYNEINRITEIEGKDVYLITSNNGRYGLMKNGKEVLKNEYTDLSFDINNHLLIAQKDKIYGVVNLEGKNIIPIDYDNIIIGGKYIDAQKGEDILIFNAKGENISTEIISYNKVNDDYAIIIDKNNNYNIVDNKDNKKLRENYTYIENVKDNYFIVTQNGKAGIIDGEGKIVIELKYDAIQKIESTNVLQAIQENRIDIIDEEMKAHSGIEKALMSKKENYIKLYSENDIKYYNLSGKEVTYQELFPNNVIYASKKNDKWGLVDKDGNIVANYQYDMVTEQNGNVAGVKKDGKWKIVDTEGKITSNKEYTISWLDVTFLGNYYKTNNQVGNIVYSGTNK